MNKAKINFLLLLSSLLLSVMSACTKEDAIAPVVDNQQATDTLSQVSDTKVNAWIHEVMSSYYYWNDQVSNDIPDTDPKSYFKSLLSSEDRFSYITDDYQQLKAEFSGVYTSMGFSPSFGLLPGSDQVFIVVEYVYPDSPANRAGLQRGDIIVAIDGQTMNKDNYYDLYQQEQYTVTLGTYDSNGNIQTTDKQRSLKAEVIATDPVLYQEVKTAGNQKVGYLVYAEFISGDNDQWLDNLGATLDEFKQAGVTDLIVDLRYNPGGEINTARYLASALAPASAVNNQNVLVKFEYNDMLENYLVSTKGADSEDLVEKFSDNGHNLGLTHIIFLTSNGTASASELLINGLKPYMNVTMVGESTVGKFYGSWVIPDTQNPSSNWAVMPLVLKYANASGVTDFKDGLTPDYPVKDNLLEAKPFGDESDPMLATAMGLISGEYNARMLEKGKYRPYINLPNPEKSFKSQLLLMK